MSDPRISGLLLMTVSVAAFLGTTSETLPPVTFFPALALFGLGAIRFLRSNGAAMAEAEERAARRVNPRIKENRQTRAHAERLAARQGQSLSSISAIDDEAERAARRASGAFEQRSPVAPIDLDEEADDLVVTTDVSFPVEVQQGDALADQLQKLNRLLAQGVLTEEEYAIAKAKLLS